jgi:hypothetical protein
MGGYRPARVKLFVGGPAVISGLLLIFIVIPKGALGCAPRIKIKIKIKVQERRRANAYQDTFAVFIRDQRRTARSPSLHRSKKFQMEVPLSRGFENSMVLGGWSLEIPPIGARC